MESSVRIEERAAEWLARRDGGDWSAADEADLEQWLSASTANRVAYLRLQVAWHEARRLKALNAGGPAGSVPPIGHWNRSPFLRELRSNSPALSPIARQAEHLAQHRATRGPARAFRVRVPAPAVACAIAIAVVAATVWLIWPAPASYRTPIGGLASVPMADGSKVTLNTNSEIRVTVTGSERLVDLERGEAFFEVVRDPRRPFIVRAGDQRVVAVGTKFSVRRRADDIRVVVAEGKVQLERDASPFLLRVGGHGSSGTSGVPSHGVQHVALLSAGSIARTGNAGVLIKESALREVEEYLSWRSGYLVFRQTPLQDAIAEFNRYNERKLVIRDADIAAIRLSGTFRSTNFEAFVRLLEDGFPVRAEYRDDEIILTAG